MVDWSWNSPEWQFASVPFALLSHWSRKVISSTMNLVQSAAIQPCWFIGAVHRAALRSSGSARAHDFHVDFYCCPWTVKGFNYYNQTFGSHVLWAVLNLVIQLSLEDACVEVELWGVRSGFIAMILSHVPLYLHFCSVGVVWEAGHMITMNRWEEVASNIFNTKSITLMPCTPWIIITGLQL